MTAYRRAAEILTRIAFVTKAYHSNDASSLDVVRTVAKYLDEMLALAEELEKQPMDRHEIDDITEQFTHGKITPKGFYALRDLALQALDHISDAQSGKLPETESTAGVIERCAKVCDERGTMYHRWSYEERAMKECAAAIRALLPSTGPVSRPVSGSNETTAAIPYAKDFPSPRAVSPVVDKGKDAERYRWLRDKSYRQPYAPGPLYRNLYDGIDGYAHSDDLKRVWLRYDAALDFAIDAAMSSPPDSPK